MPTKLNKTGEATRRPEIVANFAVTADGKVATRNHTPSLFSSAVDKRRLLEIRATGDALLVGKNTLAADNMTMGLPAEDLVKQRKLRGKSPYPLRVIVSESGRISPDLRVFQHGFSPIILYTTPRISSATERQLASQGVQIRKMHAISLAAICSELYRRDKVLRLVIEGGPTLFRTLVGEGLLDILHLTHCPVVFGGKDAPTLFGPAEKGLLPASLALRRIKAEMLGDECFASYRVVKSSS